MTGSPSQIRLLVMVLIGWCALSAAPVVANSPSLPAAFFVVAVGLVAASTLRFSTALGLLMAVIGTALFAVSMVLDPASAARGGGGIARLSLLVPALAAAISLVGVAVCASLTSWEIDGRPGAIQQAVAGRPGEAEKETDDDEEELAGASIVHRSWTGTQDRPAEPAAEAPVQEAREPDERAGQEAVEAPAGPTAATDQAGAAQETPAGAPAEPVPAQAAPAAPEAAPTPQEAPPAQETPPAARAPEAPPAAPAAPEAAPERPVEEVPAAEPAATGEASREPEPEPAAEPAAAQQGPVRAETAAGAPEEAAAAEPTAPEQPEATAAAATAAAAEEKGEEIAARDIEEKNGSGQADRLQPTGPDWRHRRRLDDDVARRLPRRRKR